MVAERLTQITLPAATPVKLWQRVEAAWSAVPEEHIQSLFESMPRRVAAVISNNGGYSVLGTWRNLSVRAKSASFLTTKLVTNYHFGDGFSGEFVTLWILLEISGEFAKTESVTAVQRAFRIKFGCQPPIDNNIVWRYRFETTGCLCKGKSMGRPRLSEEC
ncbi:transposable element Tcb1 transposase [Trichonephila clavipes]|nr:transposable element Tcb1 transposase [Trichonephila clavipes]